MAVGSLVGTVRWQVFDTDNQPASGALLYTYLSGTSTPKAVYTTQAINVAHTNPLVADADGVFPLFFLDNVSYRVEVKTSAGVTIYGPHDGIDAASLGTATLASLTVSGASTFNGMPVISGTRLSLKFVEQGSDAGIIGTEAAWAGSGTSDNLVLAAYSGNTIILFVNGSSTQAAQVDLTGSLQIGGTAARGTTAGTKRLDLFDGTAPVGTLTNGVSFYSASGEARVMDAAGNSTLLSPHDKETNAWVYDSVDTRTGKRLRVDMERMMRALDTLLGGGFIHEE